MSLSEHHSDLQQKRRPSPLSPSSSDPTLGTVGESESGQRGHRASVAYTLTSGPASEIVIPVTDYDPSSELITFVPSLSEDTPHPDHIDDYDDSNTAIMPDFERAPTLLNRLSWVSLDLGSLTRRGSRATPVPNTIFRQGSKDSGRTLTMSQDRYPVRQGSKTSFKATPTPPGKSLQHQLPPSLLTDPVKLSGARPSSPSLLHTLTPATPPPALSPTGKRYIDTRRRNKQIKQGRKEAFKTAKVLFSNERTFIHWIKFGMLLGALAMTLLNFSGQAAMTRPVGYDLFVRAGMIGQRVGMALMSICLLCLVYAACIFHWRHIGVVGRMDDDRYFDRIGPTVLTIGLLGTYSMNVILTILVTSKLDPSYAPTIFYNANNNNNNNNNNNVGMTPDQTAPVRPYYGFPMSPVFDTPRLPPGSTILVDSNDDDEDMGDVDQDAEGDSNTSQPSTDSRSIDLLSSSTASTRDDSPLEDGKDSSTEKTSDQTSHQDD